MADNFIQDGNVLTTANATGATISSGGVCRVAGGIRIAVNDIANGASGPAYDEGVFKLDAKTADTWSDGDILFWDSANAELTATVGANIHAGFAAGAKTNGQTTANVKLSKVNTTTTTVG